MIKIFLITIFLFLNLNAQETNEQLKSLQSKFETIKDLTVNVSQKAGGKEVFSGKLLYKKENKFHLDLKNNLLISDGLTTWNYNKKENKVIINSVDETSPSFFSFNSIVYDYPSKCNITSENDGSVLIFTAKENSELNFSTAKLWIDQDYLVSKMIIESEGTGKTEIIFSNYKLNQNLGNSKFEFTIPEGSTIIDLR